MKNTYYYQYNNLMHTKIEWNKCIQNFYMQRVYEINLIQILVRDSFFEKPSLIGLTQKKKIE